MNTEEERELFKAKFKAKKKRMLILFSIYAVIMLGVMAVFYCNSLKH